MKGQEALARVVGVLLGVAARVAWSSHSRSALGVGSRGKLCITTELDDKRSTV